MALTASPACLSDETVAAWVSGLLLPSDIERAEAHVAFCSSCLGRVGKAARTRGAASAQATTPVTNADSDDMRAWAELELLAADEVDAPGSAGGVAESSPHVTERFVRAEFIA